MKMSIIKSTTMKLTTLILLTLFTKSFQKLTMFESQALSDVLKTFKIRFATLSTENPSQEPTKSLKIITKNGIALNLQSPVNVSNLVSQSTPLNYPTMIILRQQHFVQIFSVYDPKINVHLLQKDERSKRLKRDKWTWMVILRPNEPFPQDFIEIPFDVEFLILEPISDGFNIWEQYHIYINQPGNKTQRVRSLLAEWFPKLGLKSESTGLKISPLNIFLRRDIKNSTLIIRKCRSSRYSGLLGSYYRMMMIGMQVMDAVHTIFRFQEISKYYGSVNDITACDVTLINHASPPVDRLKWALGPIMKLRVSLYYQQPPARPLDNYVLEPFEPNLWIAIAGWIIIAAFCVQIVEFRQKIAPITKIFQIFEAFCNQGNGAEGETTHHRIINIAIWLTVITVTASYSAIIFTFLVIRKPNVPFTNMDEFVKDGSYNYTGIYASLAYDAHELFPETSSIKIALHRHKMPEKYWVMRPRDGIMCNNPKIAFLAFANHLEEEYWPCPLKRMKEPYFETDIATPSRPFTPYILAFNQKLPLLWSSGVLSVIKKKFEYMTFKRSDPEPPPPDVDLLKHVLLIIPIIAITSTFILIFEFLTKKKFIT